MAIMVAILEYLYGLNSVIIQPNCSVQGWMFQPAGLGWRDMHVVGGQSISFASFSPFSNLHFIIFFVLFCCTYWLLYLCLLEANINQINHPIRGTVFVWRVRVTSHQQKKKEAQKKDRKQASENGLTSVHAEVAVVLVQSLQGGDVRGLFHDVVHPLDGAHHLVALRLGEDRGTFVFGDLGYWGAGGTERIWPCLNAVYTEGATQSNTAMPHWHTFYFEKE